MCSESAREDPVRRHVLSRSARSDLIDAIRCCSCGPPRIRCERFTRFASGCPTSTRAPFASSGTSASTSCTTPTSRRRVGPSTTIGARSCTPERRARRSWRRKSRVIGPTCSTCTTWASSRPISWRLRSHARVVVGQAAYTLPRGLDVGPLRSVRVVAAALRRLVSSHRSARRMGAARVRSRRRRRSRPCIERARRRRRFRRIVLRRSRRRHALPRRRRSARPRRRVGPAPTTLDAYPALARSYRGEAWGLAMLRALARARVGLNRHSRVAGGHANNLRLFETTGVGTALLTDRKADLHCSSTSSAKSSRTTASTMRRARPLAPRSRRRTQRDRRTRARAHASRSHVSKARRADGADARCRSLRAVDGRASSSLTRKRSAHIPRTETRRSARARPARWRRARSPRHTSAQGAPRSHRTRFVGAIPRRRRGRSLAHPRISRSQRGRATTPSCSTSSKARGKRIYDVATEAMRALGEPQSTRRGRLRFGKHARSVGGAPRSQTRCRPRRRDRARVRQRRVRRRADQRVSHLVTWRVVIAEMARVARKGCVFHAVSMRVRGPTVLLAKHVDDGGEILEVCFDEQELFAVYAANGLDVIRSSPSRSIRCPSRAAREW